MAPIDEEIEQIVAQIQGRKRGGHFKPFINFIQFPRYRNFEQDLRVDFEFPLTVIVGQNGSGKTSILQALSGAPRNTSPGTWWFGTALDPIDADDAPGRNLPKSEKAAFWYSYTDDNGNERRAVKTRIRRAGDPDYWEPSRPIAAYGMQGRERHPVVRMDAIYLNFKTQLNAFDRCFYFASDNAWFIKAVERTSGWKNAQSQIPPNRRRSARVQDYLRLRSKKLRKVLVDGLTLKSGPHIMHRPRVMLTEEELADISRIIGRKYISGALVEHRFYETWATSVLFRTADLEYSEAFAGSGESAVTRLVHELSAAPDNCLILLDEPETSLHPGAQHELVKYILQKTKEKCLQVVVSTHSPTIVRSLPPDAIRVFSISASGSVCVSQNVHSDEAFFVLGHPAENKIEIVVEDVLSKRLLETVSQQRGEAFASRFAVTFRPGGESGMKQDAAMLVYDENRRVHFVFDGDKSESTGPIDIDAISIDASTQQLDAIIENSLAVRVKFRQDSNMEDLAKRDIRLRYLRFVNSRFHVLPFSTPEDALWNDQTAKGLLDAMGSQESERVFTGDAKQKFRDLTQMLRPESTVLSSSDILGVQEMFLRKFCKEAGAAFGTVESLLVEIGNNA